MGDYLHPLCSSLRSFDVAQSSLPDVVVDLQAYVRYKSFYGLPNTDHQIVLSSPLEGVKAKIFQPLLVVKMLETPYLGCESPL